MSINCDLTRDCYSIFQDKRFYTNLVITHFEKQKMTGVPPSTYNPYALQARLIEMAAQLDAPPCDLAATLLTLFNETFVSKPFSIVPSDEQWLLLKQYCLALVICATTQPSDSTTEGQPPEEQHRARINQLAKPTLLQHLFAMLGEEGPQIVISACHLIQIKRPADKWSWLLLAKMSMNLPPAHGPLPEPPPAPNKQDSLLSQLAALHTQWETSLGRVTLAFRTHMLAAVAALVDQFAVEARAHAIYFTGPRASDIATLPLLEQAAQFIKSCKALVTKITSSQAKKIAGGIAASIQHFLPTLALTLHSAPEKGKTMQRKWILEIEGALLTLQTCSTQKDEDAVLQEMKKAIALILPTVTPNNRAFFDRVKALHEEHFLFYRQRYGDKNQRNSVRPTYYLLRNEAFLERQRAASAVNKPLTAVKAVAAASPRLCAKMLRPLVSVPNPQQHASDE